MMRAEGQDPRLAQSPADRALANDVGLPRVQVRSDAGGLVVGAAIAAGLGLLAFAQLSSSRLERLEQPRPLPVAEAPAAQPMPVAAPTPVVDYSMPVASAPSDDDAPIRPERLRAPSLVYDAGPSATEVAAERAAMASAAGSTASEQFADRLNSSENAPAKASHIGDLSATVIEGTLISGVLETAINSDLPGFTRAIVSEDVRSFDGTEILIPRGSRLIGQYRSGLAIGESRAFVIWTRLVLPDGVAIKLSSPVTDTLGRAGLSGKVDRHFLQRFGSAILLSIIGAGGQILAAESGGSQVVITSSAEAYGVAEAALQGNMNIPPTIKIAQGAPIRIFAARDLIFPLYEETNAVTLSEEP
jgi:type IV secretion system protein VirB10